MKKLHKSITAIIFCLILTLVLSTAAVAATDVGRVINVKASAVKNNAVTLTWTAIPDVTGYEIRYRINDGKWTNTKDTITKNSYSFKNLKIGSSYSFQVRAYVISKGFLGIGTNTNYGSYSTTVSVSNTLGKVTGLKVASTTATTVKLSWTKVSGATGYLVQKQVDGKWKDVKTTTSTSYNVTGLKTNTTTPFRVKAYVTQNDKKIYGSVSSTVKGTTAVPKISSFKLTASGTNGAKLTWSQANVTGYQIYRKVGSESWAKYKTISTKTTVSLTEKNLVLGTKYSYKIRGYYKTDSKTYYGEFSSVLSITPTLPKVKGVKMTSLNKTKAIITWDKVSGAQGYQIYDYATGSAVKLPTVSTNRTSIDVTAGKVYKIKVRAYTKPSSTVTVQGAMSDVYTIYSTPTQTKNLKYEYLDDGSVKFTWSKVTNAQGYTLYSFNNSTQKYEKVTTCTGTSLTFKKFSSVPSLNFNVAAYVKNEGVYYYGPVCEKSVTVKIIQTPVLSVGSCTDTNIVLQWTKVSEATGYVVEKYDFDKNEWTEVKTLSGTTTKCTDKCTSPSGYLYRVYAHINGNKSPVSNEVFASTTGITLTQDGAAQTITWTPVEGAAKYRVLAKYTDKDRGFRRNLANTTTTTAVVALTPGVIQSLSVYAYAEDGSMITEPAIAELVFRVDDFKILSSGNSHYDHSVNSQLLYLVEAINQTKHETSKVKVKATSEVNYNTDKFFVNNTSINGKNAKELIELVNKLTGVDRGTDELNDISLSGKETSDETLTFTNSIAKNSEGKSVNLARYIDPSDEDYAYLYASEDPSAWKDGVKSVTVTPLSKGGYKYTVVLYEETFGEAANITGAQYHPGLVTSIASLGYFTKDGLENEETSVGDTTITATINANGTLDSYQVSSPYSMKMRAPVEGIVGIKSFGMQISGTLSSSYTFTR